MFDQRIISLVLLLSFFAVGTLGQADECQIHSVAPSIVHQMISLSPDLFRNVTTESEIADAITAIVGVLEMQTSRYVSIIQTGTTNKDAFLVRNCALPDNFLNPDTFCNRGFKYVAYVGNRAFYGDSFRRFYGVNADNVTLDDLLGIEQTPYDPTTRPWFVSTGWSDLFTGTLDKAIYFYSERHPQAPDLTISSLRLSSEPCGPCMSRSDGIAASESLAAYNRLREWVGAMGIDIQEIARQLLQQYSDLGSTTVQSIFVGFANNDYYEIQSCDFTDSNPACSITNDPYLFGIRNDRIFANSNVGNRRYYAVNRIGTLKNVVHTEEEVFNTNQTIWFNVTHGFSPLVTFDTGRVGRYYSAPFVGGVAGSTPLLQACNVPPVVCPTCPDCICNTTDGEESG